MYVSAAAYLQSAGLTINATGGNCFPALSRLSPDLLSRSLHTVTDFIRALLGNDSVNSTTYTGGQQYSGGVFYVVRAATVDFCC
jgi:hypothetical protein